MLKKALYEPPGSYISVFNFFKNHTFVTKKQHDDDDDDDDGGGGGGGGGGNENNSNNKHKSSHLFFSEYIELHDKVDRHISLPISIPSMNRTCVLHVAFCYVLVFSRTKPKICSKLIFKYFFQA